MVVSVTAILRDIMNMILTKIERYLIQRVLESKIMKMIVNIITKAYKHLKNLHRRYTFQQRRYPLRQRHQTNFYGVVRRY